MTKKWSKIEETKFVFSIDNKEIGTLEMFPTSMERNAIIKIENDEFTISKFGFWKNNILITDQSNLIVAKIFFDKWYSNSQIIEYKNLKYQLINRNNPLSEYAIILENKDLLSYGLNPENYNGMINVKITDFQLHQEYIFDFLLWFLFVPIASENMGDNFTFTMNTSSKD